MKRNICCCVFLLLPLAAVSARPSSSSVPATMSVKFDFTETIVDNHEHKQIHVSGTASRVVTILPDAERGPGKTHCMFPEGHPTTFSGTVEAMGDFDDPEANLKSHVEGKGNLQSVEFSVPTYTSKGWSVDVRLTAVFPATASGNMNPPTNPPNCKFANNKLTITELGLQGSADRGAVTQDSGFGGGSLKESYSRSEDGVTDKLEITSMIVAGGNRRPHVRP